MNKISKTIKKYWITIWLIVAAISFSLITTYAIYTRITIAKRVVSTQAGASSLFSSDYMSEGGTKTIEPKTDTTTNPEVSVHVYNYIYPKEAVYRSNVTEYDLVATIGKFDESEVFHEISDEDEISDLEDMTYSITYNATNEIFTFGGENGTNHTFYGCSIAGEAANSDSFTLVFDKSELGNNAKEYCIRLVAYPYDNDLPRLTGDVMVRYSKQASVGWSGEVEKLDNSIINSYDGFNYYLEGNGKGKITFKWDSRYLTINKEFLNNSDNVFYNKVSDDVFVKYDTPPVESELTPDDEGFVYLTLEVDSTDKNRYEIQFFKVDPSYNYSKSNVEGYLPDSNDWTPNT